MTEQEFFDKCAIAAMQTIMQTMYSAGSRTFDKTIADDSYEIAKAMLIKRKEEKIEA